MGTKPLRLDLIRASFLVGVVVSAWSGAGCSSSSSPQADEVPASVANASLLGCIVNPKGETYDRAAEEIERVAASPRAKNADPRLHDLARKRCVILRDWGKYGNERGTGGENPDAPAELFAGEFEFWKSVRDLTAELKPEWAESAEQMVTKADKQTAARRGGATSQPR